MMLIFTSMCTFDYFKPKYVTHKFTSQEHNLPFMIIVTNYEEHNLSLI